ncbi:tetratricopeptide repeat protein [Alphaproteobacteria bacterium]|nr:tetratricopeptide repeat protein [Alphaproteobacteria bacterium]
MRIILILLITIYSINLLAQSTNLKKEYRQTNKYFKEKNYNKAFSSNEKALTLSLKEFGLHHLTTATLIENKGRLLLELNKNKDAEKQFRQVLDIREKLIEGYNPDIAEALNYLALSLRKQNKLKEAIIEHNKVLNIMGNVIANNPGQISELSRRSALYRARAYQTKGQLLVIEGNYSEAEGNFNIAGKIFERTLGPNKKELEILKVEIERLKEKIN